ncbi:MAG: TetR/AcrR family transcriptional regulator [Rubrivivax sp.]
MSSKPPERSPEPPPAQPPYGDPETRERILTTTRELVAERGAKLKLGDVAERAGVSRQTIYLHFGDRTGLLLAVVQHMDQTLRLSESLAHVFAAESGAEVIARTMALHGRFSASVDPVALMLEAAQYEDEALGAAWRDRMHLRHQVHRRIVQRIAELGELSGEWSADIAADLLYAMTLPAPWRELTRELGWGDSQYVDAMSALISKALLSPGAMPSIRRRARRQRRAS